MEKRLRQYNYLYYIAVSAGIMYFVYVILFNYKTEAIWEYFADSKDYKIQSEFSIFSFNFFAPTPYPGFSPRPFTVPLFYKLASSNPYNMVVLQKIVYCICVLSLIISVLSYITKKWLRALGLYLLLYYFTWWNIVGWSVNILSESLSLSFMFLWFSAILFYYRKPSYINLFLLVAISALLSFTRDTWPYIIVAFSLLNFIVFKIHKSLLIRQNILFFVFSIFLFLFQNYTSSRGERYTLPVFNSLAGRIAQNDAYLLWFKNEGMPLSEKLNTDFRHVDIDEEDNRQIVYAKYSDSNYALLHDWILKDGKKIYQKFLITHWSFLLLNDQTLKQKDRIFCSNLNGYTQKPEGFFLHADRTFPFFSLVPSIIFLILIIVIMLSNKSIILCFPLIIFILFIINALISYNADALEVKRHLFITQIVLEFVCIISLILLIDNIKSLRDQLYQKYKKING